MGGPYDQGWGNQGGYQGGYNQGGYNQGGYNQGYGGYPQQGGYPNNGYNQGYGNQPPRYDNYPQNGQYQYGKRNDDDNCLGTCCACLGALACCCCLADCIFWSVTENKFDQYICCLFFETIHVFFIKIKKNWWIFSFMWFSRKFLDDFIYFGYN